MGVTMWIDQQYLSSTYYGSWSVLGSEDTVVNKLGPHLRGDCRLVWKKAVNIKGIESLFTKLYVYEI